MQGSDLTRAPQTDPLTIYRFRDGMYAADLLTAAIEHEHLVKGSPWFVGPYFAALKDRSVCRDFVDVLRTDCVANWAGIVGHKDWHESMGDADFAATFTAAMDSRGVYLGQALARSLDLSAYARVLDVAGGSGIYACVLTAAYPQLRATVLEKSPVDRVAAKTIAERGCSDRVAVVAADMFDVPWPNDADVHLLSNVLHDWPDSIVRKLLARSFAALSPGGLLVLHDAFINTQKTGPLPTAQYSALLMHATQGKCYSIGEYGEFLTSAGFVDPEYRPTAADRGRMVARKPGPLSGVG